MVQAVTLTFSVLALVPAAILFFVAYGRYDGTFRDTTVFLFFIGGLVAGGFLGFASLFVFNALSELIAVVGIALLVPIVLVASINRRKWQGERHSIFNGGALGLGAAVMMALSFLYFQGVTLERQGCADLALDCSKKLADDARAALDHYVRVHAFALPNLGQALLLAAGLAGMVFALGLFAGNAVRLRRQFRGALLGTAIFLAPAIFVGELVHAWQARSGGEWFWVALVVAYGAIVAFFAERKLLPEGLEDDARRDRRRRKRAERAQE